MSILRPPPPTLPTTEAIDSVMESQIGTGLGIDVGSSETVGSGNGSGTRINTGSGVVTSSSNSRISAPIASEPIQNLQKWGYKYSPSSQSLNAQLQNDGIDDHVSLSPTTIYTLLLSRLPFPRSKRRRSSSCSERETRTASISSNSSTRRHPSTCSRCLRLRA